MNKIHTLTLTALAAIIGIGYLGNQVVNAEWHWNKIDEFQCCDLPKFLGLESNTKSTNDNEQSGKITQSCSHVHICNLKAEVNNYNEQESTVKDVKPDVKVYPSTYRNNYNDGDYNGGYNDDLSYEEKENYKENGLHVNIDITYKEGFDYQGDAKLTVGVKPDYHKDYIFNISDKIEEARDKPVHWDYYFAPDSVPVGGEYYVCVTALDSGDKNCNTGINSDEHRQEYIAVKMPQ